MKCQVCGRNATGVHYGVLACEGCKAFYRRGVEKKITYLCYFGNKCTTKSNTRACCKACRFQKCVTLGMKIHGAKLKDDTDEAKKKLKRKIQDENGRRASALDMEVVSSSIMTQTDALDMLYLTSGAEDHFASGAEASSTVADVDLLDDEFFSSIEMTADDFMFPEDDATSFSYDNVVSVKRKWTSEMDTRAFGTHFSVNQPRKLLSFMSRYMDVLDDNRRQMQVTVQAVQLAVEKCFSDQLRRWQECMDRHLLHGEEVHQPETTLEFMIEALRQHNMDSVVQNQKFASMLPGINELDAHGRRNATIGWKWLAFWLMHHAPFMTSEDSYVTLGDNGLRYCRYWQQMISEWPLLVFIYKFCGEFREIGLNQTETYLLCAVMMFEPGVEVKKKSAEAAEKLELIHRHYTDVLFDAVKRRCTDSTELTVTIKKLERFFTALKLVYRLHRHYFRSLDLRTAPFRAMKGERQVSVLEALRWVDAQDDAMDFQRHAPLTYKQFPVGSINFA